MKVYCTSDVHGTNVASLLELKKREPSSILIDNGDYFIGSVEATYWNHHEPQRLPHFLNEVGYDVLVPGNHDFDYGLDFYLEAVSKVNAQVVCCNLFDNSNTLIFDPYILFIRDGKRIAVVGALTSNLSQLTHFKNGKDVRVTGAVQAIGDTVKSLRDKADIIVVSYHGGIEADLETGRPTAYDTKEDEAYAIASTIKGIDILFCGHQHREQTGLVSGSTMVIQVPEHAKKVGCYDTELKQSQLIPLHIIENTDDKVSSWLDTEVSVAVFETYVKENYPAEAYHLVLNAPTLRGILESVPKVYGICWYQYRPEEINALGIFETNFENDVVIATNIKLDSYRLKAATVDNIFDGFYHEAYTNKGSSN